MVDLTIVIVSANSAHWLEACLTTTFEHVGEAHTEIIVVDNDSVDGTRELVETGFPQVKVIASPNRGFAAGCNRGIEQSSGRYVLLLNPDVEILEGTFETLVALLDGKPEVGVAGVRQLNSDGELAHTIRRFPSLSRALGEALFSARWPWQPAWAGERQLDETPYDRESDCDWPTGAFLMIRREALRSAGMLDERFFLFCEEPDLCLRVRNAGWHILHMPQMTIVHHEGKHRMRPQMIAQEAFARRQFADKYFRGLYRVSYLGALALRHVVRAASSPLWGEDAPVVRDGARRALVALRARRDPPFMHPPRTALEPGQTTASLDEQALPSPQSRGG